MGSESIHHEVSLYGNISFDSVEMFILKSNTWASRIYEFGPTFASWPKNEAMKTIEVVVKRRFRRMARVAQSWVFDNEIAEVRGEPQLGDIVWATVRGGPALGYAFYNPHSKIRLRLLHTVDYPTLDFWADRLERALRLRRQSLILEEDGMFRWVYGESDYLPGLILDVYGRYAVMQILSAGMERQKTVIIEAARRIMPTLRGIVSKNDLAIRRKEGLSLYEMVEWGEVPPSWWCQEHGIRYVISPLGGQKTGFFLDQRINRLTIRLFSKDKEVLDAYCNQGGFGLNALQAGARKVWFVDSSARAMEKVRANLEANGFSPERAELVRGEVFAFLQGCTDTPRWDLVIVDPPAFAKDRAHIATAHKGYRRLYRHALGVLREEGFLAAASCSYYVEASTLIELLREEAYRQGRDVRIVHRGTQAPDHPIHPWMDQTSYLKFFIAYCPLRR